MQNIGRTKSLDNRTHLAYSRRRDTAWRRLMGGSFPMFRLTERGGDGLCCDRRGIALGPVALVEAANANGRRVYRLRPAEEIARALALAYDPFTPDDLARRLSGLDVAARALEADDLAKATVATVLMKLPPLSADAMAKLAR